VPSVADSFSVATLAIAEIVSECGATDNIEAKKIGINEVAKE
jgi:hypothetical protein